MRKCPQVRAKKVEAGDERDKLDEVTAVGNKVINLNRAVMSAMHLNELGADGYWSLWHRTWSSVQLLQQRGKPGKDLCQKLFRLHEDERVKDVGLARLMLATVVHDAMQLNLLPEWQQAPQSPHRAPPQKATRKTCGQGYLSKSLTMAKRARQWSPGSGKTYD